jgi:hypothetical protein
VFDGRIALELAGGYEHILPDRAKMTPFSLETILSALIGGKARKQKPA